MPPAASFFAKKLGKKPLDFGFMKTIFFMGRGEHARAEQGPAGAIPISQKVFGSPEPFFQKGFWKLFNAN